LQEDTTHTYYNAPLQRYQVRSPGYTTSDTRTSKGGYYYLGTGALWRLLLLRAFSRFALALLLFPFFIAPNLDCPTSA